MCLYTGYTLYVLFFGGWFMNWFRKFMIGRYGVDQLSVGLLFLSFILSIIFYIFPVGLLNILVYIPFLLFLLRALSKNYNGRRKENEAYLKIWTPIAAWFGKKYRRLSTYKTHRYYKCPGCKQEVRVPKNKGKILITCPKCRLEFIKKT